ncbi:MAG TPA: HPr family phosphocarrier protein [Symbiobacteriaceae bacterium]|nr:HPr family phosphocarrier protein [Symbiobacteriaceae bacterium]
MQQLEVVVNASVGLHARPAANLVHTALSFTSSIFVEKGGRRVSAKSLLSVLSLGVKAGERVAVQADGADETEALAAISKLAARNFGEPDAKGV